MPGRRAIDSAIEESGSLPMSSADTASTIDESFFLTAMAFSMLARMPVTTTSSTSLVPVSAATAVTLMPSIAAPISTFEPPCKA